MGTVQQQGSISVQRLHNSNRREFGRTPFCDDKAFLLGCHKKVYAAEGFEPQGVRQCKTYKAFCNRGKANRSPQLIPILGGEDQSLDPSLSEAKSKPGA